MVIYEYLDKTHAFIAEVENAADEAEDLELVGEDKSLNTIDDLPCRVIQNFALYHPTKKQWVRLEQIGESEDFDETICVGYLEPIFDGDNDDEFNNEVDEDEDAFQNEESDEPSGILTKLTIIFHVQVEFKENGASEIWLRTQFAHYKLGKPHPSYTHKYNSLFKQIRVTNLLISTLVNDPESTLQSFEQNLAQMSKNTHSYYDNPLIITPYEFRNCLVYVREQLESWIDSNECFDLFTIPLCQSILDLSASAPLMRSSGGNARQRVNFGGSAAKDNTTPPVLTQLVKEMAAGFLTPKQRAQNGLESAPIYKSGDENTTYWYGESVSVDKNRSVEVLKTDESFENGKFYTKIKLGSEVIQIGDFATFKDPVSHRRRIALIRALFKDDSSKFRFIANVFIHGSETMIEELAGPQEFFATKEISTISLQNIMSKCKMDLMPLTKDESEYKDDSYFFRYGYDIDTGAFLNPAEFLKETGRDHDEITVNKEQIVYKDVKYHLYDFVYIVPASETGPYKIGQIVPLDDDTPEWFEVQQIKSNTRLTVRFLKRVERPITALEANTIHRPKTAVKDPRNLIMTDKFGTISIERLDGKCFVKQKDTIENLTEYVKNPDHFYISEIQNDPNATQSSILKEVKYCEECLTELNTKIQQREEIKNDSPLVALDIFSGCGGLTYGLKQAGIVDTQYSVEYNRAAAMSFSKNFPDTTVYNQCANLVLKRAISEYSEGQSPAPDKDFLGRPLPMLPPPGSVDLIYCGPPCQGFSGMNRYKKANDIKNSLIATSLSYVDFYRPDYFLLENVRGLIEFKLGGEQDGLRIVGGIKQGVLKFIIRSLTRMGYQARFSVQQAGFHGISQSRRRLFIWGTKLGKTIPGFLQPSTCFAKNASLTIPLPFNIGYVSNKRAGQCAPHHSVTVFDAISDLPRFEYANPLKVVPHYIDLVQHLNMVPKFHGDVGKYVGHMEQDYDSPPVSEFQRWCRERSTKLHQHVTKPLSELNVERVYLIPMTPGSDHHSLPGPLKPWCLSHKDSAASRHNGWKGLYGRLDFTGNFQTAITDLNPMSKSGTVIHPSQRRILSVREYARVQSFPDDFIFESFQPDYPVDMHRQIGNAVPPLLAYTLGQCLVEAKRHDKFNDISNISQDFDISSISNLNKLASLDKKYISRSLKSVQSKYSVNQIPHGPTKVSRNNYSNDAKRDFISRMSAPRTRNIPKIAYNELDDFESDNGGEIIPSTKIRKFSAKIDKENPGFRVLVTKRVIPIENNDKFRVLITKRVATNGNTNTAETTENGEVSSSVDSTKAPQNGNLSDSVEATEVIQNGKAKATEVIELSD